MAWYTILNERAGARAADGSLLAWAVAWAALLSLPAGMVAGRHLLRPDVLLAGAGVALSAAFAWSLDLATLRRLPARIVAILQNLEPAAGALAGADRREAAPDRHTVARDRLRHRRRDRRRCDRPRRETASPGECLQACYQRATSVACLKFIDV